MFCSAGRIEVLAVVERFGSARRRGRTAPKNQGEDYREIHPLKIAQPQTARQPLRIGR